MISIFKDYTLKRLYYHYNVDIWGVRMLLGSRTKARTRTLDLFEYRLRRGLIVSMKKFKHLINIDKRKKGYIRYNHRSKSPVLAFQKYSKKFKPPVRGEKRILIKEDLKKSKLRYFFFQALFMKYSLLSSFVSGRESPLIANWKRIQGLRIMKYYPWALYQINFLHFYSIEKPKARLTRSRSIYHAKIKLLKAKYYYCFKSMRTLQNYLRRILFTRFKSPLFIGLEANILNLLFRTNIYPTTRYIYNLLKIGGFLVNSLPVRNPYKILSLLDTFSVLPRFIKMSFKLFKDRLKLGLVVINIPDYISFNYKIMSFYIWRQPTQLEKSVIPHYPFLSRRRFVFNLPPRERYKFLGRLNFYRRRRY